MKKTISAIYLGIVFIFLYAPLAVMIFFSFNASNSRSEFTGFTFDHYTTLFRNDRVVGALMNTLVIALCASLCACVLGTMAAIGIHNLKGRRRAAVINVSNLPIINPEIVTGISLMLLFVLALRPLGFTLGFGTVLIAHILFNTPYVVLNVLPRLRRMDPSLYEAALDLGCMPRRAFFRVVFPEIFPGIFAGFLMAFTFSLDDFVISYFTGGTFQTLSVFINNSLKRGIQPWMLSLSGILFLVVLTVLVLMNLKDARAERRDSEKLVKGR